LVTGASAGLGAEFARQCRARGDELVLVARREDRLEALKDQLGDGVDYYVADLSKSEQIDELLTWVKMKGLEVETLINNAGFGAAGAFVETPPERLLEMIDLNVRSLTELCRRILPAMLERRRGFVLNVASTAAFQAGPYSAVYYATKAFVLSLSEALHEEAKGSGIHVTALCPGPTATEFFEVAGSPHGRLARMATDPKAVVAAGLAGLARNRAIVVPGLMNKATSQAGRILPRAALRRAVARLKA
jgi:short-subunit dehydrogenase